jgi:hypothetical protein
MMVQHSYRSQFRPERRQFTVALTPGDRNRSNDSRKLIVAAR